MPPFKNHCWLWAGLHLTTTHSEMATTEGWYLCYTSMWGACSYWINIAPPILSSLAILSSLLPAAARTPPEINHSNYPHLERRVFSPADSLSRWPEEGRSLALPAQKPHEYDCFSRKHLAFPFLFTLRSFGSPWFAISLCWVSLLLPINQ